jgi:BMFP domain-containing protein YqiC
MNITAVPFEPKYAFDIYSSVLSKIKDVSIEVGTGFDASSGLILKINSDLDKKVFSAFSQELKVQLASVTKQAEAELSKKISEMTNGAISQINIFNDIQDKINNSNKVVDAMKNELENKKKQIEAYLADQVDTAIDGAKKEVENRLKDSISNDVKDKFLNLGKGKF